MSAEEDEIELLCAWCDLAILGSYIDRGGYCWHIECKEEADKP